MNALENLLAGSQGLALKTLKLFAVILLCALLSSFVGGFFAGVLMRISPESFESAFGKSGESLWRHCVTVGSIAGLFTGAATALAASVVAGIDSLVERLLRRRLTGNHRPSDSN